MKYGFVKVAAAVPHVRVADCKYNTEQIENLMAQAEGQGIEVLCFPELCVTAYTCQDLFHQQLLLEDAEAALLKLMAFSHSLNVVTIIGAPLSLDGVLFNCAVVIHRGKIVGVIPKTYLPDYNEFYEQRWFASAPVTGDAVLRFCGQSVPMGAHLLFDTGHCTFGVEICEDLWAPIPPSSYLTLQGAELVFNLSASNEVVGKSAYTRSLVASQSARSLSGYVYAGAGFGESTQDLVFSGRAYVAENGRIMAEGQRFKLDDQLVVSEIDVESLRYERRHNTTFSHSKQLTCPSQSYRVVELEPVSIPEERQQGLSRTVSPRPFVPEGDELDARCEEILSIQATGLAQRVAHTKAKTIVVGISGGLDSTLALLVCVYAFDRLGRDRRDIVGVTMPGFGTTGRTYANALSLMRSLGVTVREISIKAACMRHFEDLGHDPNVHDVTYENSQARERTQVLMDVANQTGGFVVGTGDLSELALGWATYNGDHMSMYGVNVSVPKTLVKHLVLWVANNVADEMSRATLLDIVATPISPELIPADSEGHITQKTEDLVGPYELHDFFLYYFLRYGFRPAKIYYLARHAFAGTYDDECIKKWLTTFFRRFFSQQFKRSCLPDGPKVGSCSLSPRGDWRMPSDASSASWLAECENL